MKSLFKNSLLKVETLNTLKELNVIDITSNRNKKFGSIRFAKKNGNEWRIYTIDKNKNIRGRRGECKTKTYLHCYDFELTYIENLNDKFFLSIPYKLSKSKNVDEQIIKVFKKIK